jgi:hypothetical protein
MSDEQAPKRSWPNDYYVGPADHLHAFGVLWTAFNSFEDGIFSLYRHHLDLLKVPFPFVETGYFSLPDDKRIEAVQTIFAQCEKDPKVVSVVSNLIQYFKWCLDVRNKLAHAESYPISFFGKKPGYWHLTKRISKKNPDQGYMQIELSSLREMADKVAYGTKHCASVVIYLRVRDIPRSQRPRAYQEYEDEPLPGILSIPKPLELSLTPDGA